MQRSACNQQASGDFPVDPSGESSYKSSPGPIEQEGRDDTELSESTIFVGKSFALDTTTEIFAQIIESSWEMEDEDGEDECDGTFDEVDGKVDDTRDQSDAKGVTHNQKELGCRLRWIADDVIKSKLQGTTAKNEKVDAAQYIHDIAKKIVSSTTLEQFIEALPSEAAKSIGWDQVALYSSIIRTSIMMVGVGTDIKNSIKSCSNKYFQSRFSDWIKSQPRGWDSIFDEPIVD